MTTEMRDAFYKLCEGFDTRWGLAGVAWECYKRLDPEARAEVEAALNEGEDSPEDEALVERVAELLR